MFFLFDLFFSDLLDEDDEPNSTGWNFENPQSKAGKDGFNDSSSEQEKFWRSNACDYEARFCGHCNTTTDIKEANFFGRWGSNLRYVTITPTIINCNLQYLICAFHFTATDNI